MFSIPLPNRVSYRSIKDRIERIIFRNRSKRNEIPARLDRYHISQRIGFILITGRAETEIFEGGQRLGMNNYLNKPFQVNDLKACIEAVVGPL